MVEPLRAVSACPLCGGRGWVLAADGGAGTARPCECRKERLQHQLLELSGIPEKYLHCSLDNFHTIHDRRALCDQLEGALAQSRLYADGFLAGDGFTSGGLIYVGPTGVGKTHLAVAVGRAILCRYAARVRFVEFTELVHRIQATFDPTSPESKREILDPILEADLLILDELGAVRPTAWVQEILYLIVNTRYTRRRATLFTTNCRLDPPDAKAEIAAEASAFLAHRLPATLVSRLYEMTTPVRLDAIEDMRRETRSQWASSRR